MNTLELAKALIEKKSVSPEDAGCLDLIGAMLESVGFECTRIDVQDTSNLWATHGHDGPTLALMGHTDVVPCGDESKWQFPPFEATEHEGHLCGRGACDMKASLAAMVVSAIEVVKRHPNHPGRMAFLLTSDEEAKATYGTKEVIRWLQEHQEKVDYALVGEPSSEKRLGDVIKIGRRGSLSGKLTIQGRQGHIAYPHLCQNPIHQGFKALSECITQIWDEGHDDFPDTSFQVSNVHAGTGANNVIPGTMEMLFNFRYNPNTCASDLQSRFESILTQHDVEYDIDWHLSGEPFVTSRQSPLVQAVSDAVEAVTGSVPNYSTEGGTSDGRFIAPLGVDVVELGLVNETIHQVNERVSLESIHQIEQMYTTIIMQILNIRGE